MSIPEGFLYFGKGPLKVLPTDKEEAELVAGRRLPNGKWYGPSYSGKYDSHEYAIKAGTKLAKDNDLEPEVKAAKIVIKKCSNVICPPNYLAFQVIEQENIPSWSLFAASNGIGIDSRGSPSFSYGENMLFLRGIEKERDNAIVVVSHDKYRDIQVAIAEYITYLNKPKILYRATFNTPWGRKCLDVYSDEGKMIKGFDADKKEEAFIPTDSILGPIEKICPKSS